VKTGGYDAGNKDDQFTAGGKKTVTNVARDGGGEGNAKTSRVKKRSLGGINTGGFPGVAVVKRKEKEDARFRKTSGKGKFPDWKGTIPEKGKNQKNSKGKKKRKGTASGGDLCYEIGANGVGSHYFLKKENEKKKLFGQTTDYANA